MSVPRTGVWPYADDDPSWWDEEHWLMAVDIGIDDGGSGDTLLVSAQLGRVEQAKKLKRQWRGFLTEAHVEYFHSKDFDNFDHGVFVGLNRDERQELLSDLAKLIHRHLEIGITAKISKALYEEKTDQKFRSKFGTAFTFAVQMAVASCYLYIEKFGLKPEINVLIESHKHAPHAIQLIKALEPEVWFPVKVLTAGIGEKKNNPILQAADMLAYSEWQILNDCEHPIRSALHVATQRHKPEIIDCNKQLIDIGVHGSEEWLTTRKAWWGMSKEEREALRAKKQGV